MKPAIPRMSTDDALDIARKTASVAAGPFKECNRHPVMKEIIAKWLPGMPYAVDDVGNVAVWVEGKFVNKPLVFTAHLDTVFDDDEVEISDDRKTLRGPGTADNASGIAGLLYAANRLAGSRPARSLLAAFTVGEEGPGGLRGIRHLVDVLLGLKQDKRLNELLPQKAFGRPAAIVAIDGALGTVVLKGLHVHRKKISFTGPGGHSWGAAGTPSPIAAAAAAVSSIYKLRVRPHHTTVNVGMISGGTSVNSIASQCVLETEVRSVNKHRAQRLEAKVVSACQEAAAIEGVGINVDYLDSRPGGTTRSNSRCVTLLEDVIRAEGLHPARAVSSTEANIGMERRIPAIATGVVLGKDVHTRDESFRKTDFARGLRILERYVKRVTA